MYLKKKTRKKDPSTKSRVTNRLITFRMEVSINLSQGEYMTSLSHIQVSYQTSNPVNQTHCHYV